MAYELQTQRFVPTNGTTVTVLNSPAPLINFLLDHASTIATLTVNMPNTPHDGQQVAMCSRSIVTALTLNVGVAGGSFNITAPSTIAAKAAIIFTYFEVTKQWVRFGQTP